MNIVIGVVGALIGGFLLSFFLDTAAGGWWFTLFTAILGSVILLWIVEKPAPEARGYPATSSKGRRGVAGNRIGARAAQPTRSSIRGRPIAQQTWRAIPRGYRTAPAAR